MRKCYEIEQSAFLGNCRSLLAAFFGTKKLIVSITISPWRVSHFSQKKNLPYLLCRMTVHSQLFAKFSMRWLTECAMQLDETKHPSWTFLQFIAGLFQFGKTATNVEKTLRIRLKKSEELSCIKKFLFYLDSLSCHPLIWKFDKFFWIISDDKDTPLSWIEYSAGSSGGTYILHHVLRATIQRTRLVHKGSK